METAAPSTTRIGAGAETAPRGRPRRSLSGNGRGPRLGTCHTGVPSQSTPLGQSALTTPRFAGEQNENLNYPGVPRSLQDPAVNAAEAAVWVLIEKYRYQARHETLLLYAYECGCGDCYLWDPAAFGRYGDQLCLVGADYVGIRQGRAAVHPRWVRMNERDGLFVCNCGHTLTGEGTSEGAGLRVCPKARYRGRKLHTITGPYFRKAAIFNEC